MRGRDVDGFVRDANAAIEKSLNLPPGYWIEWGGAFENQQRAMARLSMIVPVTIFFIFVLLRPDMKEIKAFVHRNRIADVIHALKTAGFGNISIIDVKELLRALNAQESAYSIEVGDEMITEVKLEIFCEQNEVDRAAEIIRAHGRTGQPKAGWIYVSGIESTYTIGDHDPGH